MRKPKNDLFKDTDMIKLYARKLFIQKNPFSLFVPENMCTIYNMYYYIHKKSSLHS